MISRTPVSSSNVKSVGYDADTETLEVEFVSGGIYQYTQVPPSVYTLLKQAKSVGSFLQGAVKPNYGCRRVK